MKEDRSTNRFLEDKLNQFDIMFNYIKKTSEGSCIADMTGKTVGDKTNGGLGVVRMFFKTSLIGFREEVIKIFKYRTNKKLAEKDEEIERLRKDSHRGRHYLLAINAVGKRTKIYSIKTSTKLEDIKQFKRDLKRKYGKQIKTIHFVIQ